MNIKLTERDKIRINDANDLYDIMQRILLRENKIDREKEHFWIVGMNQALVILYIELVSMGSVKSTLVEPMNVFRVAILKGATRVIAVHNHPSGNMKPSEEDKQCTDRLIQVGKIIDIQVEDHMIISPKTYISFKNMGLMEELEKSLKYVPTYQLIEKIRNEERTIRDEAVNAEKALRVEAEKRLTNAVHYLNEKDMSVEHIGEVLNLTVKEVQRFLKRKKK
ncbi:JAB domain-containing protein [Prevotella sp. 10(H)]|uniref:JAB domain-containing protein n=1 Tax=Prevotella sp. 10(H) TaxID=1158294 RepID=UPI0004A6B476|nr:JAB domain-containing protein [Prevotella sp. 10(H)]